MLCDIENNEFWAMCVAGALSLLLSMLYFAYLCFEMYRAPGKLSGPGGKEYITMIVFAVEDFRSEAYYFNIPAKIQEMLLAFVFVYEPDSARKQLLFCFIILIISLGILCRAWPFKPPLLNLTFAFVYGLMASMLHSATSLLPSTADEEQSYFEHCMLNFLVASCTLMLLTLFVAAVGLAISRDNLLPIVHLRRTPDTKMLYERWKNIALLDEQAFTDVVNSWQIYTVSSLEILMPSLSSRQSASQPHGFPGSRSTISVMPPTKASLSFDSCNAGENALITCPTIGEALEKVAKLEKDLSDMQQQMKANSAKVASSASERELTSATVVSGNDDRHGAVVVGYSDGGSCSDESGSDDDEQSIVYV
jgi:hypothetical protein